jgi:hypothetical protein
VNNLAAMITSLLKHPVTKRLSIAIPLAAGIELIRSWLGFEQSTLISLVAGFAAYFIADSIFLEAKERNNRLKKGIEYFKDNFTTVVKYSVLLSVIVYFFGAHEKPSDPIISQIKQMVEVFGLFLVLMYPVFEGVYRSVVHGCYYSITFYVGRVISGIAAYSLVLWVIDQYGEDTKEWIITNPNESAVAGVSFLLVWFITKLSYGTQYSYAGNLERGGGANNAMGRTVISPKQTERDAKYTAAHESGHALVYAALGCLPPGIELVIKENGGVDGSLGYISGINSDHLLNEKTFTEWFMLALLAGKFGESFAFGENTLGSANDHQQWLKIAKLYLSNHFDGIYYSDPQNKFEQECNEEKLERLQHSQNNLLEILFSDNSQVFESINSELLEKRKMGRDDLIPHLSQIILPDNFPLPLGEFNEFSSERPRNLGLLLKTSLGAKVLQI